MFKALKDFLTYLLVSKAFLSNKNDGSYPLWPFLTIKKDSTYPQAFLTIKNGNAYPQACLTIKNDGLIHF